MPNSGMSDASARGASINSSIFERAIGEYRHVGAERGIVQLDSREEKLGDLARPQVSAPNQLAKIPCLDKRIDERGHRYCRRDPAVDGDRGAGHKRRAIGAQPRDRLCDFVRTCLAANRLDLIEPRRELRHLPAIMSATNGVSTTPGHTSLTRIPVRAYSIAAHLVRPTTPCLAAVYAGMECDATSPAAEAVLTIAPVNPAR